MLDHMYVCSISHNDFYTVKSQEASVPLIYHHVYVLANGHLTNMKSYVPGAGPFPPAALYLVPVPGTVTNELSWGPPFWSGNITERAFRICTRCVRGNK